MEQPVVSGWAMLPIAAGTMAFAWLNFLICAALFEAPSKGLEELFEMMAVFTGPAVILGVMNVGLVAGTAEELLFRGYLQTRLLRRWGPLAAIVPVSVLFGLFYLVDLRGARYTPAQEAHFRQCGALLEDPARDG